MRRLYIVLLTFTAVVMADPLSVNGQLFRRSPTGRPRPVTPTTATTTNPLFNPQVQSIWHQLGIPQSVGRYKQFRESRVNRDGNRPERETKPKLLKLTDPANLEAGAPDMLKAAAQIKMAEDLAPQKLKALKYLGTIGCGCYNKKNAGLVEGALMEALEDCTPAVRREALCVIMKQVSGGCCSCCQPACNSKSCCTSKLYKKLDEIANKTDDYGCPLEPDPSIRALASQVMNACPVPLEEKPDETPIIEKPPTPVEGGTKGGEGEEKDKDPEANAPAGDNEAEKDSDQGNNSDENASNRRLANTSQVSYGNNRLPGDRSLNNYSPADREFMQQLEVTGVVRSIQLDEGKATIEFDDPYEFPRGLNIVIAMDRNNVSFGVVVESRSGLAVIKIEDYQVLNNFSDLQRVRMGVFE